MKEVAVTSDNSKGLRKGFGHKIAELEIMASPTPATLSAVALRVSASQTRNVLQHTGLGQPIVGMAFRR